MIKTRYEKLKKAINALNGLEMEKQQKTHELEAYCKRHRSMSFDDLQTGNVDKLNLIYKYFDDRYPVEWEGGLRCDERGMKLYCWLYDDPDYLILHLTSTCENICFSGSTSWIVKAESLEDKIEVLKQIKKDVLKILKS